MGNLAGVDLSLLKETVRAKEQQKLWMVEKLKRRLGTLSGKRVAEGAMVRAHEPKAVENFRKVFPEGVSCFSDKFEAVQDSDAVMICTEWNEYRSIDLGKLKSLMRGIVLIDTRNILDMYLARRPSFDYEGVGRK